MNKKTILLTGASQGIGAATASRLADSGADIIAHYRTDTDRAGAEAALANVADERKHFVAGNFEEEHAADEVWQKALEWRGTIDVLVLNAAMMEPTGGVDDDYETWNTAWQRHTQVNVFAPTRLMYAAVRHFRQVGGGTIVLMSSWVAHRGVSNPQMMAYAASKGAIKAVAQSIARGYAKDNILTYILAPGIVRTKMSLDFADLQGGEQAVTETLAMREWVPPEEVADLIGFLSEGKVRHLSGSTIDVNGASHVR